MKIVSVGFKIILAIVIVIALYKEIYVNGVVVYRAFYYFTIQSNILTVACLLLFLFIPKESRVKSLLRGISLLAITTTGIVYNFVLYNIFRDWGTVGYTFARTITHVVAPLGFILDWLLDKHGVMRIKDVLIWLIYPIVYAAVSVYASIRHDFSLYFFLNAANGYVSSLKWIGILVVCIIFISFLFVGIDNRLGRDNK